MSVRGIKRPRPTTLLGRFFGFLFVFAFVGIIGSCLITIGIWPGQLKLLAPVFCSDAQPDAFVVSDTYSTGPGETSTNFTLYCMGPRGDSTDHGFFQPFMLISAVNGVLILGGLTLLGLIGRTLFGRRRGEKIPPIPLGDSTSGSATPSSVGSAGDSTGVSIGTVPYPVTDPTGIVTRRPDEPRPPNTAPPGSTPGPFVN